MQTYRLITIVMMLLAQDTISAQIFADLFHVTKRTILRDMDHLSSAHIPVVATRGVNGGFRLLDRACGRFSGLSTSGGLALTVFLRALSS